MGVKPNEMGGFIVLAVSILCLTACTGIYPTNRPSLWVDVYNGEPAQFGDVITDLEGVDVIYLGERHTLQRHHDLQTRIVKALLDNNVALALGLEQLEAWQQPILDKYNAAEITFDQLAEETGWTRQWSNYEQYRETIETAHHAGVKIIALNIRTQTARKVAELGLNQLDESTKSELPTNMFLDDPVYRAHLNQLMMVHAFVDESLLERIFQAQVVRDEMMAAQIVHAFQEEPDHKVVVLCGAGHVNYGLGIPARVKRQLPAIKDRIIIFSESGDVKLSEAEKEASREISITHEDLRQIQSPIADYLYVMATNTTM